MLDASLHDSFFSRDAQYGIMGMDQSVGWHSELNDSEGSGVMMINAHHKMNFNYEEQMKKFTDHILEFDDAVVNSQATTFEVEELGTQQQVNENPYDRYSSYETYPKKKKEVVEAKMQLAFEVTFEIFEEKFYSRMANRRQFKKLSANTVWTEIYSVIKGSLKAANTYYGYVFIEDYLRKEGSSFLTGGEKRVVYYAFMEYEKWKKGVNAYDFMDVVHHVWHRRYSGLYRWGHKINFDYLLVDEVQDLPPKAIKLLLSLTNENVFFAGDTAQTIAKGVGARFGDLQDIFSKSSINIEKVI
jgi:hypothetical protein